MTGQQRMLSLPKQLIPSLICPGVFVKGTQLRRWQVNTSGNAGLTDCIFSLADPEGGGSPGLGPLPLSAEKFEQNRIKLTHF
jgi:hypothetical protein